MRSGERVSGRSGIRSLRLAVLTAVVAFSVTVASAKSPLGASGPAGAAGAQKATGAASATTLAPVGISRALAKERANRITGIRYYIEYVLAPHATSAPGKEELKFRLKTPGPVLLDFRDGTISKLTVNGKDLAVKPENGHIELPAELLKLAPNFDAEEAAKAAAAAANAVDNLGRPTGPKPGEEPVAASPNDNVVNIEFNAAIATAGKAITRFDDKDDGNEYFYSLFVPMDASMAFPCFDQPDLKGQFTLRVTAPEDWDVISNADTDTVSSIRPGIRQTTFGFTVPISTYVFGFAAGPFARIPARNGGPTIYVRTSQEERAEKEAPEVQKITADGMKYLQRYFQQPYPFPKYDLVLIPGFAYGGMEHAGATFLREESVLFRTAPTHSDHLNRDILLLHELTHQWFGDMVTMRWFDDLWLKEGFAQYMAYHALADMMPKEDIWKRFYQAIKPAAYRIDSTRGTTPIYQDIGNLKDAKSAYGAIVYSKAPGVLRQLAFVLGEDKFRDGLRLYLKEHAFSNAEWADLVHAFEKVSGKPLENWADVYIKRRGMPQVDVQWSCDARTGATRIDLAQHNVLGTGGFWPISNQILMKYPSGQATKRVDWQTARTRVLYKGKGCPRWVFANDQDYAYGRFLLDARSRRAVIAQLGDTPDVFQRTLLWGSLWDSVRQAELNPEEYAELALRLLPAEKDESLAQSIIGQLDTALHRYVSAQTRAQLVPRAEALATDQMLHAPEQDMRIIWFRALRSVAETDKGRAELKDLLDGKLSVPGVELRPLDRWSMVASLVALNDPDAKAVLAAEEKHDPSGDGRKYAYMAAAASPKAEIKKKYFEDYMHDTGRPEDWVEQSLGAFNYWNQSELTLPYLRPALKALPQVKRDRKIFFVLGWLNAFIGGQQSAKAQSQVHEFLKTAALDKDLKLKVLEVSDELDRTVKIHAKYKERASVRAGGGGGSGRKAVRR